MTKAPAIKLAPTGVETVKQTVLTEKPKKRGRFKWRRVLVWLSFILLVLAPIGLGGYYLYTYAADQYHSRSAFSVRSEETTNPLEVLGAFTQAGSTSAPDSEILNDFITSQTLVRLIDGEYGLDAIYNKPENDPVFSLGQDQSIENLLDYWERMVSVNLDANSGVLEIEVRAFDPADAQLIAEAIIRHSSVLIDDLSRVAREDVMQFTLDDLAKAEARLKEMRTQIREFRSTYQIIDPEADVASQVGIVAALQTELAAALIDLETIGSYSDGTDPRLPNIQRRVDAIRKQIASERAAVGNQTDDGRSLSEIIGEYEELLIDLEFSQNAYTAALAAEEQARIEANRRNRYLAVHIPPTLAETSIYPSRGILLLVIAACAFATWSILVMIYYNVRDRR